MAVPFDLTPSMESALRFEMLIRRMESILPSYRTAWPFWFRTASVCWWQSFIVTYRLLGGIALISGILCVGIGVVPAALFATASTSDRLAFGEIMATLVLTVAARFLAKAITSRASRKTARMSDYEV
jgi:hypothetical protein